MASSIFKVFDNGEGTQIAVGANGLLLVSTDGGISWVARNSGTTNDLYGVAFGSAYSTDAWVIVGESGTILRSLDAITWAASPSFTTEDLYDVAYSGVFLAVGANGAFGASADLGLTWEAKPSGSTEDLIDITADLGAYIIVGTNDTVITGNISSLEFDILVEEDILITATQLSNGSFQSSVTESIELSTEENWLHDALGAGTTLTQGGTNQFVYINETVYALDPAVPPIGNYKHSITEDVTLLVSANDGYIRPLSAGLAWPMFTLDAAMAGGGALAGDIRWPLFSVAGVIERATVANITWPMFTVTAILDGDGEIQAEIDWPLFRLQASMTDELDLSETTDLAVWVLNIESGHHSTYSNWQANSLQMFNGQPIAAMPGGLFLMTGDDDDGEVIESKLRWPPCDFSTVNQKRLDAIFARMRGAAAQLQLVVVYDENEIRYFPFDTLFSRDGNYVKRVKMPSGLRGNIIQIGIESIGDSGMDFFELEAITMPSKRRLR